MYEADGLVRSEFASENKKQPQNLFNHIDFNDTVLVVWKFCRSSCQFNKVKAAEHHR